MAIDWMSQAVVLKTQSMFSISTSLVKLLLKYTPYSDLQQFLTLDHWMLLYRVAPQSQIRLGGPYKTTGFPLADGCMYRSTGLL